MESKNINKRKALYAPKIYYVHADHLGSIVKLTEGNGATVFKASPDPYVQMPDFSQNFNRYSYCLNNPLKYTDPTGEFFHLIIGAAIGGIVNWGIR